MAVLLGINVFFLITLAVFALKVRRHGMPKDERIDKRRSAIFGPLFQHYFLWLLGPMERALIRSGVTPNALTAASVTISAGAALAFATGRFGLAGWLYILTGVADIFDGRVARATKQVSQAGAFTDSVTDRLAEGLIFSGLAWYYRDSWLLVVVLAALIASFLVSYTRARGEGLGVPGMDVGTMQRPERIFMLGVPSILSPWIETAVRPELGAMQPLIAAGLIFIAVTSLATSLRRFVYAYGKLKAPATPPANPEAAILPAKPGGGSTAASKHAPN